MSDKSNTFTMTRCRECKQASMHTPGCTIAFGENGKRREGRPNNWVHAADCEERLYVAVDALTSDEAMRAAVYSQLADRCIDVTAPGVQQAIVPDEYRWERNAIQAAVDAVTGQERST